MWCAEHGCMKSVLTMLAVLALHCAAFAEAAPMTTKPAINDPPRVKTGARPYEMEGRLEDRTPLFGFQDLRGWTVELHDGAQAELVRTREQQLWGDYVARLTFRGASSASRVVLRPPQPIPIPEAFDSISFWIYGSNWGWVIDPKTPQVPVSVLIVDSSGRETSFEITRVRWKEWWLAHKKLPEPILGASFAGVQVSEMSNAEDNTVFLNSLYFFREKLEPLEFQARPRRNLTPFPGQDQGQNTGPGKLSFPTREETILPDNLTRRFTNTVTQGPRGSWVFRYAGSDCTVEYVYTPRTGSLGEVTVHVDSRPVSVPMSGGGIEFADGAIPKGELVDATLTDGVLKLTWRFGTTRAQYAFRIWQKSLVMDFICRGGQATGLSFGEVQAVEKPRLVLVPFLTLGASPKVLCSGQPESPVFTSIWADWYRSNGSELWSTDWVLSDTARINGGIRYIAKTDGKRNDLYERVFLTISPTFEETLPNIPNPPSPLVKTAGERLWQESWGPENYATEHERSKILRSYGIEKLTQCNHEIAWRDGGESFTVRTRAAPGKGGDEALERYIADQQSLGWLSGLYTNYTDFAPVNENWSEDIVQLTPDGEWRPAWPRCYALKPSRAVEFDAKFAPIIQKKFGSNAAYTDVHTAVSPWAYCDYDARVPGAGTFAATFYAYGEILQNDQRVYGPTWSEGTFHWLYAGLATGNYALCYNQPDMSNEPLNVAFDLMKIHPLEADIGMPWTSGFFKSGVDWQKPENIDQSIDHFIAATIAYGHIGWLVEEVHGIQRTCRSYYMLQQLQKRYAGRRPAKIEYAADDGRWLTVSQAIATEQIKRSRLHVCYDNGLEVYVNGSHENWNLPNGVVLPIWGWYARDSKGGFVEYSALADGRRIDYVKSAEYEYLDGRGVSTVHNGLAARGSIVVRRKGKSVEVIDIHGNDEIGVSVPGAALCEAFGPDGKSLGNVDLRRAQSGTVWFEVKNDARSYVVSQTKSDREMPVEVVLSFPTDRAVPGDMLSATITCKAGAAEVWIEDASLSVGDQRVDVSQWRSARMKSSDTIRVVVPVTIPRDAVLGSRMWARVAVSVKGPRRVVEQWYALTVSPPFEIGLNRLENGLFSVRVHGNVIGAAPAVVLAVEPDGGPFALRQTGSAYSVVAPEGPPLATGKLIVKAVWRSFKAVREFPLKVTEEHRLIREVIGREGFAWGYALRGEPERRIGDEGFSGKLGAVVNVEELFCGGVSKKSVFMHPPYVEKTGYTFCETGLISLPEAECEFRGFVGLRDGGVQSDGVVFSVFAIDQSSAHHKILEQHWKERKWHEVSGDLSAFRGKTIRLRFVADTGPSDNPTSDWASWGEPRIVEKTPLMRVEIGE